MGSAPVDAAVEDAKADAADPVDATADAAEDSASSRRPTLPTIANHVIIPPFGSVRPGFYPGLFLFTLWLQSR